MPLTPARATTRTTSAPSTTTADGSTPPVVDLRMLDLLVEDGDPAVPVVTRKELANDGTELSALAASGPYTAASQAFLASLTDLMGRVPDGRVPFQIKDGELVLEAHTGDGQEVRLEAEDHAPDRAVLPSDGVAIDGVIVEDEPDPGNFYCEHMLWSIQQAADQKDSSVLENEQGETLTGFLHFPPDAIMNAPPPAEPADPAAADAQQAQRHASTRKVVGAAIRGYVDEIRAQIDPATPACILLTGYGPFMTILNNPTGDFVTHASNLDAAVAEAFGASLLTPKGVPLTAPRPDVAMYRYQIGTPDGGSTTLNLCAACFPVSDDAISPDRPTSVQQLMQRIQPHAVLSMGVNPGAEHYLAEYHADSGDLVRTDTTASHDDSAISREAIGLADNFSLIRAMIAGSKAIAGA